MEAIWQDLRHAFRMLLRTPAFTATAVIVLALGIGANTAIFSVVESVLLRPAPYRDPSRLVELWNTYPPLIPEAPNSAGDFRDFRGRSRTLAGMVAYIDTPRGLSLTGEGEPERVEMRYAASGLLPLLGVQPVAGRGFTEAEDLPSAPMTVMIGYRFWQERFGSNPQVVGRRITLDGEGYTVMGVMPKAVSLAPTTDVWLPIGLYDAGPDPYRFHEFHIIGRLNPGVTIGQAQTELAGLNAQQQRALPDTHRNFGIQVTPIQTATARRMRTALLILLGAVGLVLLVACANFINLLMARHAARRRELAARLALGASRGRLLSHLLAESVLLSLAGGMLGILVAPLALGLIRGLVPAELAAAGDAGLDLRVLAFTLGLSLMSGIGCGLIPALQAARLDVHRMLQEGLRTTASRGGQAIRRVLVVAEIALAVILLSGAGLLMRSFHLLMEVDPGFRPSHVLTLEVDRPQPSPAEQAKWTTAQSLAYLQGESTRQEALMDRIRALPGVAAAGGISVLPLGRAMQSASRFLVEGQPIPANGVRPFAETRNVSPGYFAAMGIPLRQGRWLEARDFGSQNIVVNQAFAERFWPGGNALGKRVNFCSLEPLPCWTTVVGVVRNVHQYGLESAPTFDSYGAAGWQRYLVVRTASDPASITRAVIREIQAFDRDLPVTHVMTLDGLLAESVATRRLSTLLVSLFAGLGLVLAAIGVYAVMSYAVRLRTNEIGVRMALGARPGQIWRLVIGSGARLVLAGIAIGLAGALALTRLLSSLLYGVTATDPATFGGVALVLAPVALLACYFPARRAMRIDPIAALRLD